MPPDARRAVSSREADGLADANRAVGADVAGQCRPLRRKQHDHGRSHVEPTELGAAVEGDDRVTTGKVAWLAWLFAPDPPGPGAPTNTTASGPVGVSKTQAMRSLRANRPGTLSAVVALTLNRSPGMKRARRSVPAIGICTRW